MKQRPTGRQSSSEKIIRDIKRRTRKQYNAEEKIRIVLDGLRGEDSIVELCRREVGIHTENFASALHSALREDPDVILVGELRDLETISAAVTAAEMGILVMGTLHTNGAGQTVDRIVNTFPADKQSHIRTMLSTSLRGVISQQLLPTKDKSGRVAALEILVNTAAVANIIRQEKMNQLETAMQSGRSNGMLTMDTALMDLVRKGRIGALDAYHQSNNKHKFKRLVEEELAQEM